MQHVWLRLTLACSLMLSLAAAWSIPAAVEAIRFITAGDDPAAIADVALDRTFDSARAEREIAAALAADDVDLAQSFVALAEDRGVAIDPALLERVTVAKGPSASQTRAFGRFVQGFVTGEPVDGASFAGTAAGDLFVFGDVRDALREGVRAARGQEVDRLVLGLAAAGLAITAGTYASFGAAAPARAGLSLAKAASRTGRIGAKLAQSLRLQQPQSLVRFAGDLGKVQSKAGARAALDGLKIADHPKDVARLARLAEAKGSRTRAIVKVLGRGAIVLTTGLFDLASWIFWAIANLIGLCATLKRWTERTTLRVLRRRKAKAAMRRAALAGAPAAL